MFEFLGWELKSTTTQSGYLEYNVDETKEKGKVGSVVKKGDFVLETVYILYNPKGYARSWDEIPPDPQKPVTLVSASAGESKKVKAEEKKPEKEEVRGEDNSGEEELKSAKKLEEKKEKKEKEEAPKSPRRDKKEKEKEKEKREREREKRERERKGKGKRKRKGTKRKRKGKRKRKSEEEFSNSK